MALRSLIKISAVNNLSDARYAAGMGVELLGFDLVEGSDNFVSPEQFGAITSWISGVKLVGEVGDITNARAIELLNNFTLDYLQVSDQASLANLEIDMPLIFKIDKVNFEYITEILHDFSSKVHWFLIEPPFPLTDEQLSWYDARAKRFPLILGSNVTVDKLQQLKEAGYQGFALQGGHEIKPGYMEFDHLAEVLEALELED